LNKFNQAEISAKQTVNYRSQLDFTRFLEIAQKSSVEQKAYQFYWHNFRWLKIAKYLLLSKYNDML